MSTVDSVQTIEIGIENETHSDSTKGSSQNNSTPSNKDPKSSLDESEEYTGNVTNIVEKVVNITNNKNKINRADESIGPPPRVGDDRDDPKNPDKLGEIEPMVHLNVIEMSEESSMDNLITTTQKVSNNLMKVQRVLLTNIVVPLCASEIPHSGGRNRRKSS